MTRDEALHSTGRYGWIYQQRGTGHRWTGQFIGHSDCGRYVRFKAQSQRPRWIPSEQGTLYYCCESGRAQLVAVCAECATTSAAYSAAMGCPHDECDDEGTCLECGRAHARGPQ
jgi:hypothetical protein